MPTVKFVVPKGSIEEVTFKLLEQAWQHVSGRGRTYRVKLGDPDMPFCSERCRLIDLGNWASGKYVIPGAPAREPEKDSPDDDEG